MFKKKINKMLMNQKEDRLRMCERQLYSKYHKAREKYLKAKDKLDIYLKKKNENN